MLERGSAEVSVAMWSVLDRSGARHERLVVQRTVIVTDDAGSTGRVDQVWISGEHRAVDSSAEVIRQLGPRTRAARPWRDGD